MLWLLFCLLPLGGSSSIAAQEGAHKAKLDNDPGAPVASRPEIYYCRSPNMEDFTCWWHPVDNLTSGQQAAYILTYSKDMEPELECPDYMSGGLHSCYFDKSHTSIWMYYCMTVTAMTPHRNYTSQQHCLDVAEIVEPEAPVNLTFSLRDAGGDEAGHSVLLSWTYPAPEVLRYGWITLLYELQYRRIGETDNWQVKHHLREPHVELLGLRPDDYIVRVRCRSHNSRLWSKWSAALLVSIPNSLAAGKVLVLVLVVGVGAVALLVIAFGVIPQSRRIKDYFLPPIPKPRIIGIDPLLLKKGNFDEINRHFSNFHGYRPPSYSVEVWDQVSADGIYLSAPRDCSVPPSILDRDRGMSVAIQNLFPIQNPSSYIRSAPPYCAVPAEPFTALQDTPSPWQQPETVFVPGSDYSTMERLGVPDASVSTPDPARAPVQDFYTCVQLMRDSGEVHLVPCLPAPYCQDFLLPPGPDAAKQEEEEKKSKRLAEYQARKSATEDDGDDRSDAADPLLPFSPEDTSERTGDPF
ncbi:prolactin receptor isoform X2 [Poecilia latipinna]|uniref:Growth hormone receptor-like n=1 Tax=Poecilia latipinna TaxID=48699 RepID=A0A3B3VWU7_9TELE|nr:PREDICTED: prolactin receptor-like isoform X2 [Poecilia latipinna]